MFRLTLSMQSLTEYMKEHGQCHVEGHMQDYPKQVETIRKLISENNIKTVMEIGFNAGHSCEVFLTSSPDVTVTSFDINQHGYTAYGVRYIMENYPGRLEFIPGSSTDTVPAYPDKKFDLIFVDGAHDYGTALQDLHNCRRLARPGTIVIMDDTVSTFEKFQPWNDGPVRAWGDIREDRLVKELFSEDYDMGRGMSIGKYLVFDTPEVVDTTEVVDTPLVIDKCLTDVLHENDAMKMCEGHSQIFPVQVQSLYNLSKGAKNIMEIGFNAGHSCEVFLTSSPDTHVTSFDINMYPYTKVGADYFAKYYPGRHEFIAGNSLQAVPLYAMTYRNKKFDLIFIDGGHDYETALGDLHNCKQVADRDTIVVMDDIVSRPELQQHWNEGPIRAWDYMIKKGYIIETSRQDYMKGRGVAVGRYVFA